MVPYQEHVLPMIPSGMTVQGHHQGVRVMDQDKRRHRKLKRDLKCAGSKSQRRQLKRDLEANPAEAHESEVDLGRRSTESMNGIDNDATRAAAESPEGAE